MVIALIILALLAIAAVVWGVGQSRHAQQKEIEVARLQERLVAAEAESKVAAEIRFNELADRLLHDNTLRLQQGNCEQIKQILDPLHQTIDKFEKQVRECYNTEARERFSLQQRISELVKTGEKIGTEADRLTCALRGNTRVQGDWGEMVLETILEQSGLERDQEYKMQVVINTENGGNLRPDAVVFYPGKHCMVIDAKTSMTDYMAAVQTNDPKEEKEALDRHCQSLRSHVDALRRKSYQDLIGEGRTADFVMMFIPGEGPYLTAMKHDPKLWNDAYSHRILIVSPTHLVASLKLVEQVWRHDRQTTNAIKIAEEAGKMYDKLSGFLNDMVKIRKSITDADSAWENAMKKLSTGTGNLLGKAEKLRKLGARATKDLPDLPAD